MDSFKLYIRNLKIHEHQDNVPSIQYERHFLDMYVKMAKTILKLNYLLRLYYFIISILVSCHFETFKLENHTEELDKIYAFRCAAVHSQIIGTIFFMIDEMVELYMFQFS